MISIMSVYKRETYLQKIRGFYHDTGLIKVITGVRRCGKSCLMESIAQELHDSGIDDSHIVYLDLDTRKYRKIKTADQLESLIDELTPNEGKTFLFIDEVQNVADFEEVLNAFRGEDKYSIFITGSNSYLLSGELVTKLTGRFIEFEMFPLTFDEYLGMKQFLGKSVSSDLVVEFDQFLREGGFPKALEYDRPEDRRTYIASVITEIFQKDIKKRIKIRNVAAFQSVQTYLINNFGATTSLTNLMTDMGKAGIHIKRETLNRYIAILKDAKILCECNRFDLKSRRSIGGEQKFYLSDLGFYFATNTDNRINFGPALENITYIYARAHGHSVSVGRIGTLECDFILRRGDADYAYVQVAMTIMDDKKTEDREYAPLEKIRDNYPKFVLTRNDPLQKRNGILHENLPDFMRQKRLFIASQTSIHLRVD